MKEHFLSVFYPHLTAAMEQTGYTLEKIADTIREQHVQAVDIGLEDLSKPGTAESLKQNGLEIASVYVFCNFQEDPENFIALDVINLARKYEFKQVLAVPGMLSDNNPDAFENILTGL